MKKVLLTGLLALGFGFTSVAQDGAADLFERAKAAHGGAALENMVAYRDAGNVSVYDDKEQVVGILGFRQTYDLSASRVRVELLQDNKAVQILQTTPTEAWSWTEQSGVIRLPAVQAKPIRDSLSEGLLAFRAKTTDVTNFKTNGTVKIGMLEGTSIEFTVNGVVNKPVIATDGTILGTSATAEGLLAQTATSDYRVIAGVKISFSSVSSLGGKVAFAFKTDAAEVNPILTDTDFARPTK